jgi:hypothetical protein
MTIVINGTNTPVAGSIGYGDGTNLAFTAAGTTGQVLTSATAGTPTWGAVSVPSGSTISAPIINDGYTEETNTANSGAAYTIDLANGSLQIITLTASCTFTFPTVGAGKSFMLLLKQNGTGGYSVTWPSVTNKVQWPAATAPTITSTASKLDKFVFTSDGTNWYGSTAGQNYTV